MVHHRGEVDPFAAGSRPSARLRAFSDALWARRQPATRTSASRRRAPDSAQPSPAESTAGEQRGPASPPGCRAVAGRVERACARPDISDPQRVALAERTHVSEMSQAIGRVESSRDTRHVAAGSRPLARSRASLTRYGLDASRRQPRGRVASAHVIPAERTQPIRRAARNHESDYPLGAGPRRPEQP
jgi:hypothetical protein